MTAFVKQGWVAKGVKCFGEIEIQSNKVNVRVCLEEVSNEMIEIDQGTSCWASWSKGELVAKLCVNVGVVINCIVSRSIDHGSNVHTHLYHDIFWSRYDKVMRLVLFLTILRLENSKISDYIIIAWFDGWLFKIFLVSY